MHSLRLLGGFALLDDSGNVVARLSQRRAEAVLAVLGVAGDVGCPRDRLLGLLWPDSADTLARHSLRSALHALRTAVSADVILSVGDDVRLNPAIVACDVQQALRARDVGRLEDVVAHWNGAFLDGFHVDDAEEFERWMEEERTRLRRVLIDTLSELAERATAAGDLHAASGWWERALEHDPHDSRMALRLVQCLTASGDRANALVYAELHRRRLAADLEIEPDQAFESEVARLRQAASPPRGTPYIALDTAPAVAAELEGQPSTEPARIAERFRTRRAWMMGGVVLIVLLLLHFGPSWLRH